MEQFKFVGENLRHARGDRTQEEVANSCDISPSAVAMYENGQRMPRDEVKLRLANYFGTTVEALFFTPQVH